MGRNLGHRNFRHLGHIRGSGDVMTREEIWTAAITAGDRSMQSAGRAAWNSDDWTAMVEEFDRLCPPLELMPTAQIRAEVNKRVGREHPKPKRLKPCAKCGQLLGARERRLPCPGCGARNWK
jgi:hypothetical protein